MPRVASETSNIQPHHHPVGPRRQAGAEAKQPSSPFAVLLHDTGETPPPTPHDPSERARPSSASTNDTQPGSRAQGGQEHGGDRAENRNEAADAPQPAPDESTEANAGTPASAADAKSAAADAADGRDGEDKPAQVDVTEIALLAAAAPADAAATRQPVASEQAPATAAIVPTVALPAVEANANAADANATNAIATDAAASSAATVEAAASPGAQAQPAGKTGAGESGAEDADDTNAGRIGNVAASGADGSNTLKADNTFDADKTLRPKLATSAGTKTPGTTEAAASDSAGDVAPQVGAPAEPNPTDKSEPALVHSNHAVGQSAEPKPGETAARLRTEAQAGGTADALKPTADAVQLAPLQHPADRFVTLASGGVHPNAGAGATDQAAVSIAGLAVEIAARAQAGRNRFEIRLDPPELGRIDVRLDIDRNGQVTSRLMVEKAETLDLLRRDAPELERALQQAGLKTSDSGLQFTLRDQSFGGQNQDSSDGARSGAARLVVPDPEMAPVDTVQGGYGRSLRLGGGIDIRV